MANVSNWKGWEKTVALALGGKRRFRTMGSFATSVEDIRFPKAIRKQFPKLKNVAVECKKRKSLNIHALFAEAVMKYGKEGKQVVLASKVTHKRNLKARIEAMKDKLEKNSIRKFDKQAIKLSKHFKGKKLKKQARKLQVRITEDFKRKIKEKELQLRLKHDITALVTVDLNFFKELWEAWLWAKRKENGKG